MSRSSNWAALHSCISRSRIDDLQYPRVFEWQCLGLGISTFGVGVAVGEAVLVVAQVGRVRRPVHLLLEILPPNLVEGLQLRAARQKLDHSPSLALVRLLSCLLCQILPVWCFGLCWNSKNLLERELRVQLELQKLAVTLMMRLELEVGWELWKSLLMLPLDVPLFLLDGGGVEVYSRPEAEELLLLT